MTIFTADDLLEPDDVCLDVGAGTGRHTRRMAERVGLFGEVHAFEPRPLRRRLLRARTWTLIQVTVADPAAIGNLDAYCERRVAVIRIAAQVRTVLAGAAAVLRRDRPVVLLDGPPDADSVDGLRRAGYRIDAGSRLYLCTPPSVVRHLPVRGTA